VAEPSDDLIDRLSTSLSSHTGAGIVIDIGTGDGRFVYQCARSNPNKFFIGIDPNTRPLAKVSEKIHRSPRKGGLPNVLFLQASVEDLPAELEGIADEIHIHFPWGSLLRIVCTSDHNGLRNIRRICSTGALLEVVIGFDPERDRSEIDRLGLSAKLIDSELAARYREAGFEVTEQGEIEQAELLNLQTSWAKRLRGNQERKLIFIIARAID
jgi:16S rRNA (adenine(1408)-N(1))-methyltransferase